MSLKKYEKLPEEKSFKKIFNLQAEAIEALVSSYINPKNSGFFKKASIIAERLKSAREYEASAEIALVLLGLEAGQLKRTPKPISKTGELLLNEILSYGDKRQKEIMKLYLPEMPENCRELINGGSVESQQEELDHSRTP